MQGSTKRFECNTFCRPNCPILRQQLLRCEHPVEDPACPLRGKKAQPRVLQLTRVGVKIT